MRHCHVRSRSPQPARPQSAGARFPPSSWLMHQENGKRVMSDDLQRDATQDRFPEVAMSIAAHHQEIGPVVGSGFDTAKLRLNAMHDQILTQAVAIRNGLMADREDQNL